MLLWLKMETELASEMFFIKLDDGIRPQKEDRVR